MKKLIAAGNLFLKHMDLTDVALLKFCVGAAGVLLGLRVSARHKKSAAFRASFVMALTLVPLLWKWLRVLVSAEEE